MLKFDQVSKEFKDGNQMIEAVKSTSLTFDKGELIAIVEVFWFREKYIPNNGWRTTNAYTRGNIH